MEEELKKLSEQIQKSTMQVSIQKGVPPAFNKQQSKEFQKAITDFLKFQQDRAEDYLKELESQTNASLFYITFYLDKLSCNARL